MILKEFKEFAIKGSMMDMAIGIVIGAAFGAVVNSMVTDIIMPITSGILRVPDFTNLFITLHNPTGKEFATLEEATKAGGAVLSYGRFMNVATNFIIVTFALFMIVKQINRLRRKKEEVAPPPPTKEEELLGEIRDLLRNRQGI